MPIRLSTLTRLELRYLHYRERWLRSSNGPEDVVYRCELLAKSLEAWQEYTRARFELRRTMRVLRG